MQIGGSPQHGRDPAFRPSTTPGGTAYRRLFRLDELIVLANAPVGGEQQELHAGRDDAAVLPRGHVPQETDGVVVAVGTTRAKGTAAVAHPLLVSGVHARFECVVAPDVEGRGEVGAVRRPDLFDQSATRCAIGLM